MLEPHSYKTSMSDKLLGVLVSLRLVSHPVTYLEAGTETHHLEPDIRTESTLPQFHRVNLPYASLTISFRAAPYSQSRSLAHYTPTSITQYEFGSQPRHNVQCKHCKPIAGIRSASPKSM
jgi:hypothetical protein